MNDPNFGRHLRLEALSMRRVVGRVQCECCCPIGILGNVLSANLIVHAHHYLCGEPQTHRPTDIEGLIYHCRVHT